MKPTAHKIREMFFAKYGALIDLGAIQPGMVEGLVSGIAFTYLAGQDESVDIRSVLAKMQDRDGSGAVEDLILEVNHKVARAVGR